MARTKTLATRTGKSKESVPDNSVQQSLNQKRTVPKQDISEDNKNTSKKVGVNNPNNSDCLDTNYLEITNKEGLLEVIYAMQQTLALKDLDKIKESKLISEIKNKMAHYFDVDEKKIDYAEKKTSIDFEDEDLGIEDGDFSHSVFTVNGKAEGWAKVESDECNYDDHDEDCHGPMDYLGNFAWKLIQFRDDFEQSSSKTYINFSGDDYLFEEKIEHKSETLWLQRIYNYDKVSTGYLRLEDINEFVHDTEENIISERTYNSKAELRRIEFVDIERKVKFVEFHSNGKKSTVGQDNLTVFAQPRFRGIHYSKTGCQEKIDFGDNQVKVHFKNGKLVKRGASYQIGSGNLQYSYTQ